jgi:hypothetical protein
MQVLKLKFQSRTFRFTRLTAEKKLFLLLCSVIKLFILLYGVIKLFVLLYSVINQSSYS